MAIQQEHAKFDVGTGNTIARITKNGLHFEIIVNLDDALKVRKGNSEYLIVEGDKVFSNVKKGDVAANDDLEIAFKTTNIDEIGKIIVKKGDVLVDQAHRSEEQEKKIKQVVDFLSTNAIDPQSGNPISPDRIKSALEQAHVNIKNTPIDSQIQEILAQIVSIIPIRIETKKVRITIPAIHTGKIYGIIAQYKEKEDWLNDGSLEVVVNIPAGIIMDFYDKLNSMTHGSALTEEVKDE
jgi:ribosome maturation protein SDO1